MSNLGLFAAGFVAALVMRPLIDLGVMLWFSGNYEAPRSESIRESLKRLRHE
jgi:hypothetical protein